MTNHLTNRSVFSHLIWHSETERGNRQICNRGHRAGSGRSARNAFFLSTRPISILPALLFPYVDGMAVPWLWRVAGHSSPFARGHRGRFSSQRALCKPDSGWAAARGGAGRGADDRSGLAAPISMSFLAVVALGSCRSFYRWPQFDLRFNAPSRRILIHRQAGPLPLFNSRAKDLHLQNSGSGPKEICNK